jgi:UDP-N-acetyl-D-glucosamine dehydrogenase
MPTYVVQRTAEELDRRFGKGLNGSHLLIVGLAYKKNVDDTRESPALRIMELLEARGATAAYHDPHVPTIPSTREHGPLSGRQSIAIDRKSLSAFDAVLVITDHDAIDWDEIAAHARLIVDTRNKIKRTASLSGA